MIWRLAVRYSFSPVAHHRRRSLRIMMTAAVSLAMFLAVISIMDYLQGTRIANLRDVRSFDIVIDGRHEDVMASRFPESIVFEYAEAEALAEGRAVIIRYIGDDYDGGLNLIQGDVSSLAVSYPVMRLSSDNSLRLTMLREGRSGLVIPQTERAAVSGLYATALGQDFDSAYIFMPMESAGEDAAFYTALKHADTSIADALREEGFSARSWMESESVLYSAFMTEKTMMIIVLSFLFLILLVSMKESVRIFYESRKSERAELWLLGLGRRRTSLSFMLSFLIVLFAAACLALVIAAIALLASEGYLSRLMLRDVHLPFPWKEFFVTASLLALFSLLIAFLREKKEDKEDILEVLIGH